MSQTALHIQVTHRRTLAIKTPRFLGNAEEAATYCREMAARFPLLTFQVVTRPVEPAPSHAAAQAALAAIESRMAQYA